jgi:hypothetical protein
MRPPNASGARCQH